MQRRFAAALRVLALLCIGVFHIAGLPDNGLPDNGLPDNGLPDNGLPDNGLPDNGNSPDALINSPLFFNRLVHGYWVSRPFNAATLSQPDNPLARAIVNPYSALVMAYQWQLCHPQGSNATVTDALGRKHTFQGLLGLCVLAGGHGWHKDQPLDLPTARWLSAATITQVNRYQIHNRFSARGHVTPQLTAMTPSMTSYLYKFGTASPVEAFQACRLAPPTTGRARCGWKPHFVGLAKERSVVRVTASSHGVRMLLQANLGIHGANPGEQGALAISGNAGAVNPKVEFIVPTGGTFNIQWAADPRPTSRALPATVKPPVLTATVVRGGGTVQLPADEVFVFPNREMYSTSMLFNLSGGDNNIASIPGVANGKPVTSCEPTISAKGELQYCVGPDIKDIRSLDFRRLDSRIVISKECIPCRRSLRPGQRFLAFPNAHMWLASSWTKEQDYYALRSCSSDLSTCVAKFEGFIDANYCGPANARCTGNAPVVAKACDVQSKDLDTLNPRPYAGPAQPLLDAAQCHIGAGGDTGYGVTTFFANYGDQGACWAVKGGRGAICGYKKKRCRVVPGKEGEIDCGKDDLLTHPRGKQALPGPVQIPGRRK